MPPAINRNVTTILATCLGDMFPSLELRRGVPLQIQQRGHPYLTTKNCFDSPLSVGRKPIGKRGHESKLVSLAGLTAKAGKGHYCRARITPQSSTVGGQVASLELARNPPPRPAGTLARLEQASSRCGTEGTCAGAARASRHESWGENYHVRRETLRQPLPRHQQLMTLVYFCLVVFSQSSKLAFGEVPGASRCPAGLYFFFCSSFRRAVIRSTVLSLMARNWFTRSTGDRDSALNILMTCSCRLQRTPFNSDCCFSSRSNNLAS